MAKFPVVWNVPSVPEVASSPDVKEWAQAVVSFLKQFLVIFQLLTSTIAVKVNNELMSIAGTNKVTGTIDMTNGTQFIPPVVSGDFATPATAELWYNSALHHLRLNTDNEGVQSIGLIRPLAQNQALGNGVASVAVTLSPAETDTNYQVIVETTWGTVWSLGATKAVGGFTITFGTATPDASQSITYCLIR